MSYIYRSEQNMKSDSLFLGSGNNKRRNETIILQLLFMLGYYSLTFIFFNISTVRVLNSWHGRHDAPGSNSEMKNNLVYRPWRICPRRIVYDEPIAARKKVGVYRDVSLLRFNCEI